MSLRLLLTYLISQACWAIIVNFFETISLCFFTSSLLGIARDNSRFRIFCHIVGIILLLIGFLLPSFEGYNYEQGSGGPGEDQLPPVPPLSLGPLPLSLCLSQRMSASLFFWLAIDGYNPINIVPDMS